MRPKYLSWLDIFFGAAGLLCGFQLAKHPEIEPIKLFNVIGIAFDIVGVVILSYIISSSEKFRNFVTKWVSTLVISALGLGPLGFFVAFALSSMVYSNPDMLKPFLPLVFVALPSVFFIESFVYAPPSKRFSSTESRTKALGGYFLLSGLFLQLYAAILELRL